MKSKIAIISALVFVACKSPESKNNVLVKGTYVTSYQSEFSKAMDTLEITPLNESANTYSYTRRTGYQRISNGIAGPYQYETENSTCVFDRATAQLNEQRHGRIYFFSSDGNSLVSGSSVYKRIQ